MMVDSGADRPVGPVDGASAHFGGTWDPASPERIQDPYAFWAEARRATDLFYSDAVDAWVVTRYADVESIVTDDDHFSNADAIFAPAGLHPECAKILSGFGWTPNFDTDPPEHTRIRRAVSQAFTARRVRLLEPKIRRISEALTEDLEARGSPADIVKGFCLPLPSRVIFEMLGIPDDDLGKVHHWTQRFIELYVAHMVDDDDVARAKDCVDYWEYCLDLIDERMASPAEDLISGLVTQGGTVHPSSGEDAPLSREEIASVCMLLVVAGHETTTNMLGNALLHLLGQRNRWKAVKADPALRPKAIEEALRVDAPVQVLHRVTRCPVEVGGVSLPVGAKVLVPFGAANHDDAVFDEPDQFDLERQPTRHLAFSKGTHYCLGAALARLEGRVALDVLVERLPSLRLVDEGRGRYREIFSIRSLYELVVAW